MASRNATGDSTRGDKSPKDSATEVFGLVRDYAKQETVDPLKGLANYTKWGAIAAVLVGIALVELMIAVLRVTQTEGGDTLDGNWSWVPYLVTLVVATLILVFAKSRMSARKAKS